MDRFQPPMQKLFVQANAHLCVYAMDSLAQLASTIPAQSPVNLPDAWELLRKSLQPYFPSYAKPPSLERLTEHFKHSREPLNLFLPGCLGNADPNIGHPETCYEHRFTISDTEKLLVEIANTPKPLGVSPLNTESKFDREYFVSTSTLLEAKNSREILQLTAEKLRVLSGMDRILVYRFDKQFNGEVIEESTKEDLSAVYLGLHFPSTDIPEWARKRYESARIRVVFDTATSPQELVFFGRLGLADLGNLSSLFCLGVNECHLRYLKNMGVRASLSIPIMDSGKLWGLFACHNNSTPLLLDFSQLSLLKTFGIFCSQIFSMKRAQEQKEYVARHRPAYKLDEKSVTASEASSANMLVDLGRQWQDKLISIFQAKAAVLISGNECHVRGENIVTPEILDELRKLVKSANNLHHPICISSDNLAAEKEPFPQLLSSALCQKGFAGALIVAHGREMIALLRGEITRIVNWAGAFDDINGLLPKSELAPRASFSAWQKKMSSYSLQWTTDEQALALEFLTILQQYVSNYLQMWSVSQAASMQALAQVLPRFVNAVNTMSKSLDELNLLNDNASSTAWIKSAIELLQQDKEQSTLQALRLLTSTKLAATLQNEQIAQKTKQMGTMAKEMADLLEVQGYHIPRQTKTMLVAESFEALMEEIKKSTSQIFTPFKCEVALAIEPQQLVFPWGKSQEYLFLRSLKESVAAFLSALSETTKTFQQPTTTQGHLLGQNFLLKQCKVSLYAKKCEEMETIIFGMQIQFDKATFVFNQLENKPSSTPLRSLATILRGKFVVTFSPNTLNFQIEAPVVT